MMYMEESNILERLFLVSKRDNLDRYYIFKLFGFAIFLHRLHHNEHKDVFHNHPWNGFSIIFGKYLEEKTNGSTKLCIGFNWIGEEPHRIELPYGPVWTLFIHFPRCRQWMVCDRSGNIIDIEPWRGVGGRTSYIPGEKYES